MKLGLSNINSKRQLAISTEMDGKLGAGNLRCAVGRLVKYGFPRGDREWLEQMHYVLRCIIHVLASASDTLHSNKGLQLLKLSILASKDPNVIFKQKKKKD